MRNQDTRYSKTVRRSLMRVNTRDFTNLRHEFRQIEHEISSGVSEWRVRNKFIWRLWMSEIGDWTYWGGTKVVSIDKNNDYRQTDENWFNKIRNVYETVTEKTNRRLFGRRYLLKNVSCPTSLVFYERGDLTEGRHIHTVHQEFGDGRSRILP